MTDRAESQLSTRANLPIFPGVVPPYAIGSTCLVPAPKDSVQKLEPGTIARGRLLVVQTRSDNALRAGRSVRKSPEKRDPYRDKRCAVVVRRDRAYRSARTPQVQTRSLM